MSLNNVLLTRRAVLQAALETTYNLPAAVGPNDAILVSTPTYTADPEMLKRDFTRASLSKTPHIVGRMMAKMEFTTELRGNGSQNLGTLASQPRIVRLFQACGYALSANAGPTSTTVFQIGDQANPIAWVSAGVLTNTDVMRYVVQVTTPGPSGTAKVSVTNYLSAESTTGVTLTSGSPLAVGTKGLTITPTFSGNLAAGSTWYVYLLPPGLILKPISTNVPSLTLVMNKDGVQHTMPGAFGTFEITSEAGKYASVKWTFMGTYVNAVDAPLPTLGYETTLPAQVELARLSIEGYYAVCSKFSFNQNNSVQIREDVNSPQGYIGTRITDRNPEGGIDPEADLVGSYDFWSKLRNATRMAFDARVGTIAGNTVWMICPVAQYTKLTYTDRSGLLTYDAGLSFSGYTDDDEAIFAFT